MVTKKYGRQNLPKPRPKSIKYAFHLNKEVFKWTFANCFWEHKTWKECKEVRFFVEHVIAKLQEYEKQTWQEILNASGGKSTGHGNNNHFISGDELPRAEKNEFTNSGYMEKYEKVFSLRLSGKERLIGFVDLNIFNVLWFDINHEFF